MSKLKILLKKDIYLQYSPIIDLIKGNPLDKRQKKKLGTLAFLFFYLIFLNYTIFLPLVSGSTSQMESAIINSAKTCLYLSIFITFASSMGNYYFNEDVKIVFRLPVKTKDIIESKILVMSLFNFIFYLVIFLPTAVKYGIQTGQNSLFFVSAVLSSALMSISIVSLLSIILIFLMQYMTKIPNLKNKLQSIYMFLGILVFVFIQIKSQNAPNGDSINFFGSAKSLPLSFLFEGAIGLKSANKLIYFSVLLLLAGGLFFIATNFMHKVFVKGAQQNQVASNKKKKVSLKGIKNKTVSMAITSKEIKNILKTPIYFFNIMLSGFFITVILIVTAINITQKNPNLITETRSGIFNMFYKNPVEMLLITFIVGFLLSLVAGITNDPAVTSISREGKNIYQMKYLPISAKNNVNGRIRAAIMLKLISFVPMFIMAMIILGKLFYLVLPIIVGFVMCSYFVSNLGLFIDIQSPKLIWTTPQQAIKQNLNILKLIAAISIIGFIFYKFIDAFITKYDVPFEQGIIYLALIPVIFTFIGYAINTTNIKLLERKLRDYEL